MVWAALKALGAMLARVPWQAWAAIFIAAGVLLYGHGKYKAGFAAAEAQYVAAKRDAEMRVAIERELTEKRYREQENRHAHTLANLDRSYSAERVALEERARRDRDAARDGALRLRVPGLSCPGAAAAEAPAPQGTPGGGDDPAPVELPRAVTEDLLQLVNDADAVADQLRACQAVIRADRASQGTEP